AIGAVHVATGVLGPNDSRSPRPGLWWQMQWRRQPKAYDDPKAEPLQGGARGDEGFGGARELRAGERARPFADRSGQDARLADQWLRLLHPHAHERSACPRRKRGAPPSALSMARIAALQRAR